MASDDQFSVVFFVGKVSPLDALIVIHPFLVRNFLDETI